MLNRTATVAVTPARERRLRARLFDALEAAYSVRFEGREPGALDGAAGLYAIGPTAAVAAGSAREAGVPALIAVGEETDAAGTRWPLALADHGALARPLRGARLSESWVRRTPLLDGTGEALATIDGAPAWMLHPAGGVVRQSVAAAPAELADGEALRSRLAVGRCLALLALTQFVIDLTTECGFQPPPVRAAFVLDDPNLRWPTYGHVRYGELLRSAAARRYHTAIAMVPLDAWPAHPRAVRLFREGRAQLSICTHGNDHNGPELGRPRSCAEALPLAAQAIARTAAFERRTGVPVDRVMVPPHERLSEGTASALVACGFEALCHTRPYPWITQSPDLPWLTRPAGGGPLVGWRSAEVMSGGLPLLLRRAFDFDREDLSLRAYLGQPLIISGHHDLLEHGTIALEEGAAQVNRLGEVQWCSLGQIARSSFETRRDGDVLQIRVLGRRISVDIPAGVRQLNLDLSAFPEASRFQVRRGASRQTSLGRVDDPVVAVDGPGRVGLRLPDTLEPVALPNRRLRLRPLARRLVSEGRDRARPMATRVARG